MERTTTLLLTLAMLDCGSRELAEFPQGEPDDNTAIEDQDPVGDPTGTPDGNAAPGSAPRLPHPSAFGLDLSDSGVLDAHAQVVVAREVQALLPEVATLEVVRDLDVTDDLDDPYAWTLTIRGKGPDCGGTGRVLFAVDTRDPGATVLPAPPVVSALAADLTDHPTPACVDKEESKLAPAFGPGFWAQEPCDDDFHASAASGAALTLGILAAQASAPGWGVACAEHVEPVGVSYCEGLVGSITSHLLLAQAYQDSAQLLGDTMADMTEQAMQIAVAAGLGFGGAANAQDVKALAALGLKVNAAKKAADMMTNLAATNIAAARGRAALDPILEGAAGAELSALVGTSTVWRIELDVLTTCYRRVTNWIVNAAAVGFGIRFFWPPGGLNIADPGTSEFEEGSTVLFVGPKRVQSTQYFFTDEISIDIDALSSEHQAMTRREQEPNVLHTMRAGYETPGYVHALTEDVLGPHPLTLLPTVLAPAGAPIELGDGGYGGASHDVAQTLYTAGTVYLGAAGVDLNMQETDAGGTPLGPLWEQCKVVPEDPADPRYCGLGVQTTVPPWQIGDSLDRYWRIWTMGGIVDPADGAVIEPEGATFFVSLHATGEGPTNECWVWDYGLARYEQDPTVPGCGVGGDGGDTGDDGWGDGGGSDSGGGGGLPPPPG